MDSVKNKFKVSVIMAHYNGGDFIWRNLDSLLRQTMSQDDFEVIVVDDKSTQPLDVIESYRNKFKNYTILKEKKNNGYPSIPRNHGIDIARGIFVMLIDQDDYLADDALERFFECADNDTDIIVGKYAVGDGFGGTQAPFKNGSVFEADIIKDNLLSSLAPHKMYRKSMLDENDVRFLDSDYIPVGEDQVFNLKAYASSRKISILADKDYYFWVKREDSGNLGKSSRYDFDSPDKFINLGKECFDVIINSTKFNDNEKDEILAIYIGRLFNSRGKFFKTLKLMGSDENRQKLIEGIREKLTSRMSNQSLKLVRDTQNYLVQAINAGIDYKDLSSFRNDVLFNTSPNNTLIDSLGRVARRFTINGNMIEVPLEFLNDERFRVYRSHFSQLQYICDVGLETDILPNQGEIKLIVMNRKKNQKVWIETPITVISAHRGLFELNFKNNKLLNFLECGFYDVFLEVKLNNRINKYRIGQNRNLKTTQSKVFKTSNKEINIYFTKFDNISIQVKEVK